MEHPAHKHGYITTFSGLQFRSLGHNRIARPDITHSLGMLCRYLGHVRSFYSVAEHSVLVSLLAELRGEPPVVQQAALLHDAHEAYCGDFPSPFKLDLPEHEDWERRIQYEVREALELPREDSWIWPRVKRYDTEALHIEAYHLLPPCVQWVDHEIVQNAPGMAHVDCLEPRLASFAFRRRAEQLGLEGF